MFLKTTDWQKAEKIGAVGKGSTVAEDDIGSEVATDGKFDCS